MAFECQKSIEVFENSELEIVNSCDPNQIEPTPDSRTLTGKSKTSASSNRNGIGKDLLANFRLSINDLPTAMICEILDCLEPKELGIVSCVSKTLHRVASEHRVWKQFYCERWGLPEGLNPDEWSWKDLFVERDYRSRTFLGRYSIDVLYGHTDPVRAVSLLVSAKLVFTSGYDSVVRMWDLEEGLAIASSPSLGCTVRAIAADTKLLVVGTTDGFVHGWKAVEGLSRLFDIQALQNSETQFRLWEHSGPVTSLALDLTRVYSGSWDMTVRIWDRVLLKCTNVLRHNDWVYGLVPHDTTLVTSSGSDVYIWDLTTSERTTVLEQAHTGYTSALARSHAGDFVFTGGADGAIHMLKISNVGFSKVATWAPHTGHVHSLSFEFPWLVSASSDGKMSLIDVRKLVAPMTRVAAVEPPQRMLHGFGSNLFAVVIGGDRIISAGEEGVVRIWNFTRALENERRARAMRGIRLENRMRRRKLLSEISGKNGTGDQCSVLAKKNSVNGDRSGVWHSRRAVNSTKLKA